jgi:hypothetical protein
MAAARTPGAFAPMTIPVSLGCSCQVKDAITAYWQPQPNYPFDWAFTPLLDGAVDLLCRRFDPDLLQPKQLGPVNQVEQTSGFPRHQVHLLHHDIIGNSDHRASWQRKCTRLLRLLDDGEHEVLFIRATWLETREDLGAAHAQIAEAFPMARFRIVATDFDTRSLKHTAPGWKPFIHRLKQCPQNSSWNARTDS